MMELQSVYRRLFCRPGCSRDLCDRQHARGQRPRQRPPHFRPHGLQGCARIQGRRGAARPQVRVGKKEECYRDGTTKRYSPGCVNRASCSGQLLPRQFASRALWPLAGVNATETGNSSDTQPGICLVTLWIRRTEDSLTKLRHSDSCQP